MNRSWFRLGAPRLVVGMRAMALLGVIALLSSLIPLGGSRASAAQFDWDGEHILQCSCPVWWWEPWEGEGTFDEDESLDEVILENGNATVIIHEIPVAGHELLDLVDMRTNELEGSRRYADLEEIGRIDGNNLAIVQRRWVDRNNEDILSFQHVQVWEENFFLSIEFNAPDEEFVDLWDSLEDVHLVGTPILSEYQGDAVHAKLTGQDQADDGEDAADASDATDDSADATDATDDTTDGTDNTDGTDGRDDTVDLEDIGVVEDGLYESPNYGYEVEWTDDWTVDAENSASEDTYDFVQFISEDGYALSITGQELDRGDSIPDYVDRLLDNEEDEYNTDIVLDEADEEEGGYLGVYETEDGVELVVYSATWMHDDDLIVTVILIAPPDEFEDALDAAQDAFSVDGEPVLELFRTREIRNALDL
jgi:hypothetical protein